MPNSVDTSTATFNNGGIGFTSDYFPVDPSTLPVSCNLPDLVPLDIPDLTEAITSLNASCKFNFQANLPSPPVFIPKVQLPPIPCPTGYNYSSDISFTGTNATVGGSLGIFQDESSACGVVLRGGIDVNVPPQICPTGMGVTGTPVLTFVNSEGSQDVSFGLTGGPCEFILSGGGTIQLPEVPCPNGTSFTSSVVITGAGSASGQVEIQATGGPCNFDLEGGGTIYVPPIPCPDGMSFSGDVHIGVVGEGITTLNRNGEAGGISIELVGGPCNWKLVGGGTIVIPPVPIPSFAGCADSSGYMEIQAKVGGYNYTFIGSTATGCNQALKIDNFDIFTGWDSNDIQVCQNGSLQTLSFWTKQGGD